MRPLKITQAAAFPFPSPQGSQVYVRGMARALARRGHEVTEVCYAHGVGEPDPEYRVVRTPSVPGYDNLRAGPDLVKPILDLALAAQLARIPADLVHAHNYEAPVAARLASPLGRTPLVYNAHNTMGEELHTYFEGRVARGLARRAGRLLDRTVPRLADHALGISPGAVPTLRSLGCAHVTHVAPGLDPAEFGEPVAPAPLPPGPWVVYAGNPDRYQDLDVLVEAMRRLPEAGLLLVSASALSDWEGALPKLELRVTSSFSEVKRYLAAAAVAALPRTTCTGYPIKLLNYLAMGRVTVAAEGSAQPLPGVVTVPNRDPVALAAALRDALEHPERTRRLGASARAHVMASCTWDARAAELESVYREVLFRKGGAKWARPQV